jgi:hypothetical protein
MSLEVNELASPGNGRYCTLNITCIHMALYDGIYLLQALGRHADIFWVCSWDVSSSGEIEACQEKQAS